MPETVKRNYVGDSVKMVPKSTIVRKPEPRQSSSKFPADSLTRGTKATGSPWPCDTSYKSFTELPPVGSWPKKGK